jgi:hypothetical protein
MDHSIKLKNTPGLAGHAADIMIPPNMDREEFAERKQLCAEYLARIAQATDEHRKELFAEWAEKLYDPHVRRRSRLMKSLADLSPLLDDLALYNSGTTIPLLGAARPNESESEAIRLAIAGRTSAWLAKIALLFPAEAAAVETSDSAYPETIAAPGRRRGYRQDVRRWMTQERLRVLPEAAKRLGISLSTLKSICSDRGKRRYGEANLIRILGIIGDPIE